MNELKCFPVWISNPPWIFVFLRSLSNGKSLVYLEKTFNIYAGGHMRTPGMCCYSRTCRRALPNPCPCSHSQTLIPTHFLDSCCSFPVERGYPAISSPEGIGTHRVRVGRSLSYLARVIALILMSSAQHIFGKFWKQLGTFLPIHDDHWHFHEISCHRVSVIWPQRKHIRKVTGQQSRC